MTDTETVLPPQDQAFSIYITMYRCLENMFNMATSKSIFELALEWNELPLAKRNRSAMDLANPDMLTVVMVEGLERTTGVSFEYDPDISIDGTFLDEFFEHDRIYHYPGLVTILFTAAHELYKVAEKIPAHDPALFTLNSIFSAIGQPNLYGMLRDKEPLTADSARRFFTALTPLLMAVDMATDSGDEDTTSED